MNSLSAVPTRRLRDEVLGRGVSVLTLDDVVDLTGLSRGSAREAMRRTRDAGHFFAPAPGLYVAIPPEFSTWGVVPAMDFIDQMMGFLGCAYYVGLLSAAELHGAAHQRPQAFQVMVDRAVTDRDFERVKLRFHERADLKRAPVVLRNSRTAQVRVSSPEVTVFDLADRPKHSGSLDNVATIYGELVEEARLDPAKVAEVASQYPLAVVRRVGWLFDRISGYIDASVVVDPLHAFVSARSSSGRRPVDLLSAGGPRRGHSDTKWGLVVNTEVEPDL